MRRALIAIGLLATTGLTGCDVWNQLTGTPAPAPVACNCAPPIRGSVAPAPVAAPQSDRIVRRTEYRGHRAAAIRGYRWHDSYAERSVESYGYSSASHSEGEGYGAAYDETFEAHHGDAQAEANFHETTRVWADGYGRRHIYDDSAVAHYAYQAQQRRAQSSARRDPWHGYDEDWDE